MNLKKIQVQSTLAYLNYISSALLHARNMSASSNNIEGKLDVYVAHKINWLLQLQKLNIRLKRATITARNTSTAILLPNLKLIYFQCLPQVAILKVSWMYS